MKKVIILTTLMTSAIILLSVSCQKDENGNRVTYYKTIGEGYVWDETNNKPFKDVIITVTSPYGTSSWAIPRIEETFTTDENGYYQIRFPKRVNNKKVTLYLFKTGLSTPPPIGRAVIQVENLQIYG